jgi:hypothetical protein
VLWRPVGWLVLLGVIGVLARTSALERALAAHQKDREFS